MINSLFVSLVIKTQTEMQVLKIVLATMILPKQHRILVVFVML
jgi:hypothetical protein